MCTRGRWEVRLWARTACGGYYLAYRRVAAVCQGSHSPRKSLRCMPSNLVRLYMCLPQTVAVCGLINSLSLSLSDCGGVRVVYERAREEHIPCVWHERAGFAAVRLVLEIALDQRALLCLGLDNGARASA